MTLRPSMVFSLCTDNWLQIGDMPEIHGSYATEWRRLKRWLEEGVWNEIMESLRDSAYNDGKFSMDTVCVNSSFIETKKGRKFRLQRSQEEKWNKDSCLCKL
jgi:hypothetical protein